jgi:homoserine O-acetyltransferase/O-succinyltransferase
MMGFQWMFNSKLLTIHHCPFTIHIFMFSTFRYQESFTLTSGETLPGFHLGYTTLGKLNADKSNAVWVFHALTANSDPSEWWAGLVGEGKLFDPASHFIVCVNMPGSCYGSIHPLDVNPATGNCYYHDFPLFTPRDMIRAYQYLKNYLEIESIYVGLGGSMGGQQLLEWAIEEPALFKNIIPIATNAFHSPWAIAFNASQRFCIEADVTWKNKNETAGTEGMKVARSIALLSYRNYDTYLQYQSEEDTKKITEFKSESYQRYQGKKLADRFNAFSYYTLSKSMDAHNTGRERGSVKNALSLINAATLVISISSDILFPVSEQQFLADHINGASIIVIDSTFGHDGFLLEFEQIETAIKSFLEADKKSVADAKLETVVLSSGL